MLNKDKVNNMLSVFRTRFLCKKRVLLLACIISILFIPEVSFAKVLLDATAISFKDGSAKWQSAIYGYASSLFWKLAVLDFTWTTIVWVKDRKEIGEILTGFVGKTISVGFFWLVLFNSSSPNGWVQSIIDSFSTIGKSVAVSSGADVGTLDSILTQGFTLALNMYSVLYSNVGVTDVILHPIDTAERTFMIVPIFSTSIIVSLGFALIAGQLLVTMCESYIAIYGGIIMLGFGGSRWTSDMATSYLKFAVGTGMKLMLCYMVIGLGFNVFSAMIPATISLEKIWEYVLTIIPITLIYVYLVFNIPGLASSIMSGSPNMSLGGMAGAAITAGAGIAGAGALAKTAGGKMQELAGPGSKLENAARMGSSMMGTPGRGSTNLLGSGSSGVKPPGSGLSPTGSFAAPMESNNQENSGGLAGDIASTERSSSVSPAGSDFGSSLIDTKSNLQSALTEKSGSAQSPSRSGVTPSPQSRTSSSSDTGSTAPVDAVEPVGGAKGNASGASVVASDPHTKLLESMNANLEMMANGPEQARKLHQKISALRDFVPNDGATVQTGGISMGHTKD